MAALLIACDGRVESWALIRLARRHGHDGTIPARPGKAGSEGSRAGRAIQRAMRQLLALDLVARDDGGWVALNLADLAAWVADELDEREEDAPDEA